MKNNDMLNEPTMSMAEMCEFLKVNRNTIYTYMRDKDLPNIRIGTRVLFLRSEVNQWLNDVARRKCTKDARKYYRQKGLLEEE